MRIKLFIITALFLSLFLQQGVMAKTLLQATVSNNAVVLGDFFTLTVTINDNDSDFQLDTKQLENEFNVSRPSRSSNNSYINGKFSQQTRWQMTLQAKRIGELTIPALKIGDQSTKAIKISVSRPSKQANKTADNAIFMENSLNKSSVYLGQPLIFTSKIFIAKNVSELQLIDPTLADATVSTYGEDKKGETIRNGLRYTIITRQFQISANKSGTFTINSPLLTGNSRDMVSIDEWQNRIVSKPINIRGDSLAVTIKAKPTNYQGDWLISEDVHLFENPPLNQQSYHVGEPITRSITLQIASINKDKMPILHFNYPKNLRFYPDQDELKEGEAKGLIYSERTMRHAIIADKVGQLTLPEIKLPWWNSETDKQEFAIIPAQTLTILAAEKKSSSVTTNTIDTPAPVNKEPTATVVIDNSTLIYWKIISALLLLLLIGLILYHLTYRRLHSARNNKDKKLTAPFIENDFGLQVALKKQQPSAIYQALLNYAQNEYPTLKSLSQLTDHVQLDKQDIEQLAIEIKALENACTHPSENYDAAPLSLLIKKQTQQKSAPKTVDIMDLNPDNRHR